MPYTSIFVLLFLYFLLESGISKQFWLISFGLIVTGILAVFEPVDNFNYLQIFLIAAAIEVFRLTRAAIRPKKDGAQIIAVGFASLFVFSTYDLLMDFGMIEAINDIKNGYPFGFIGRVRIAGLADLRGVPFFIKGFVKRKFPKDKKQLGPHGLERALCQNLSI